MAWTAVFFRLVGFSSAVRKQAGYKQRLRQWCDLPVVEAAETCELDSQKDDQADQQ